jgi:hypothetical protein
LAKSERSEISSLISKHQDHHSDRGKEQKESEQSIAELYPCMKSALGLTRHGRK